MPILFNYGASGAAYSNTKSMVFDGVDERGTVASNAALLNWTSLTAACWVKSANTTPDNKLFGIEDIANDNRSWYLTRYHADGAEANFYSATGGHCPSVSTVFDGNWHHVCGVWDGTTQKIYIDGVLERTRASTGTFTGQPSMDFSVASFTNNVGFYTGKIDEIIVFKNRALSDAEVTELYNSGHAYDYSTHSQYSHAIMWYRLGDLTDSNTLVINRVTPGTFDLTMSNMEAGDIVADVP